MAAQRPVVLVVGAAEHSLGWHVSRECEVRGFRVVTAGIQGEKEFYDVTEPYEEHEELMEVLAGAYDQISHVVCTAGINNMTGIAPAGWGESMRDHMAVNYEGVVKMFEAWRNIHGPGESAAEQDFDGEPAALYQHFVAISSNSAHIARTNSLPYCASKAALSMALRCLARENAGRNDGRLVIYGYEPGWLDNTPMSNDIRDGLNISAIDEAPHRIPGNYYGINPAQLAELIANELAHGGRMLNGCMLRVDGGEQ